jgi:hypothetical protein
MKKRILKKPFDSGAGVLATGTIGVSTIGKFWGSSVRGGTAGSGVLTAKSEAYLSNID